jgi:hypothetical protein
MQDEQEFHERRTYGSDEHFERADVTDEHEDVGDLRRGGQARHSPGDESHEGWSEGDVTRSRRGETDRQGGNEGRTAGRNKRYGRRSRELAEGSGHRGGDPRTGTRDAGRRESDESDSGGLLGGWFGGIDTANTHRDSGVPDDRPRAGEERHSRGHSTEDTDSGGFLNRWFGSDEREQSTRGGDDRSRGGRSEGGHDVGEYARRNRDTPRHANARETTGTSDSGDRHTTRRHAGTDEEGRTDRPDFGDIGPMGGEEARSEARQQGYAEQERRRGREGGTGHGTDVTEQVLERGTTAYSDRHESRGRRGGDTDDRSTQRRFGRGRSDRDEGSESNRGTDRHERGSGQGTQQGERHSDRGGRTSTPPDTTGRGTTTSGERGTTDRAGQRSDRQHGTRRKSQSRHSNPSQGSQRGSHREEGLSGRLGDHFGDPSAGPEPEEGGERQFGGERGRSERNHQYGSQRGHGSQRRERFGSDRDENDRSGADHDR